MWKKNCHLIMQTLFKCCLKEYPLHINVDLFRNNQILAAQASPIHLEIFIREI